MGKTRRNHNHEIGETTESDLLKVFSDMIENHWRKQIFDADGELKPLDIHLFQINGEDNSCGITVKANPSDDQPGNGCVIFKNAQFDRYLLPFSWQELIIDPNEQCMDFVEKRFRFLNSDCTVRDIYTTIFMPMTHLIVAQSSACLQSTFCWLLKRRGGSSQKERTQSRKEKLQKLKKSFSTLNITKERMLYLILKW